MSPTLTCLALALVGVDVGYRPAANGGVDFVIHINPATLQALRPGQTSDLDVSRKARAMRASHFSITPWPEKLPGKSLRPHYCPQRRPDEAASPVLPAATVRPSIGRPEGR